MGGRGFVTSNCETTMKYTSANVGRGALSDGVKKLLLVRLLPVGKN